MAITGLTMEEARSLTRATLTLAEVASLLGVDPRTASAAASAGDIPSVRVGRRILIPRAPLLALLDATAQESSVDHEREHPAESVRSERGQAGNSRRRPDQRVAAGHQGAGTGGRR
ncbi:hypothetical protein C5C99_01415 [Rathayibacter sp. AY1C4]|uniref:helix-turn-helix domain-containing protein n=1 Tax=Rathayibacter sp. AY1C4 TaxID=2080537 RepID=UPI000CE8F770|nr:helix-turn-helix domain-containing protein [Rathayibacter sp. AY1C4]PPH23321.1 hypothetical protein C5C99_01415 [Rathayibacter sp. AY1C4]